MKEILPGVFHWITVHPRIQIPVSSYYLGDERALLDPFVPEAGFDGFGEPPEHVFLTNRHHYRQSGEFVERFGCTVWCVESGLVEFTKGEAVRGFQFGDELLGNVRAIQIGVLCPDETALFVPRGGGILAVADGVVRNGDGPLVFVPDEFMGEDPEGVKAGLRKSYASLLEQDFDHLLLAHGDPWIGGGKQALREFTES